MSASPNTEEPLQYLVGYWVETPNTVPTCFITLLGPHTSGRIFPFLHLCEIRYACIFVERQAPTDGFIYDHPKSTTIEDSVGRLPFNPNCCGSIIYRLIHLAVSPCVYVLEAKRFVGPVMTVSLADRSMPDKRGQLGRSVGWPYYNRETR